VTEAGIILGTAAYMRGRCRAPAPASAPMD
jgi:hypothetical protein